MAGFNVSFRSFEDVRHFVQLATVQPYEITVTDGRRTVDAKSLMVMFSLDYRRPLTVRARCTEEEFLPFLEAVARFRV